MLSTDRLMYTYLVPKDFTKLVHIRSKPLPAQGAQRIEKVKGGEPDFKAELNPMQPGQRAFSEKR